MAKVYTQELGLCLGIGGSLLMEGERSLALAEAVKETPLSYLLLETDGPYVKPKRPEAIPKKQWEKARNTSLILPAVAGRIAQIKGISEEEVIRVTDENVHRVFGIGRTQVSS